MKQRNQFATEEEYTEYLKLPKPFFSYDPHGEFELHATAEEAEASAKDSLEYYADDAADSGWDDSVEEVCWGEIRGEIIESKRVERKDAKIDEEGYDAENEVIWDDDAGVFIDYELVPARAVSPMQAALQRMLDVYPMSSNPAQTRAKIEAYKALGWKESDNGMLVPPDNLRIEPVVQNDDSQIEITGPQFFEDDEPCGYCERPIGEKHKNWCRQ